MQPIGQDPNNDFYKPKESEKKGQGNNQQKINLRGYLLREVGLNNPDSIALAHKMLEKNGIQIADLDLLNNLQQQTDSSQRDDAFAKKAQELQQRVISQIKERIK